MYRRILVPVDGSATSSQGLQEAIALASLCGAQLRLVHVVDEMSLALAMDAYSSHVGDWLEVLREGGQKILEQAVGTARAAGIEAESCMFDSLVGSINDLILAEARRWNADLIVLGTHGRRGPTRWVLGSTAENIVRRAPVPVLLVRAPSDVASGAEEDGSSSRDDTANASAPAQALAGG